MLQKRLALGEDMSDQQTEELKKLKKSEEQLLRNQRSYENVEKTIKKTGLAITDNLVQGMNDFNTAVDKGKGGAFLLGKGLAVADTALSKFYHTTKDLIFAFDEVTKGFEKQFQLGRGYRNMLQQNYEANLAYGATLEEVSESFGSLIKNTTDFTLMSKQQRTSLLDTSTVLQQQGIAVDDFSRGVQNSMKLFGQSGAAAQNTSLELMETARSLRISPGQLAADYAKMGGSLAKLGKNGPQAFKEIARVSKITGLEMEKLLQMTNKFDTFEGAATAAGQLNAALGGNFVNAMDLMMATDPVERFEMMRGALDDAGLSWDSMSYYQRIFYAEAMGLENPADLALVMSGNMDMLADSTMKSAKEIEEERKRAQEMMTVKEKLNAVLLKLAVAFLPLVDKLDQLAMWLLENEDAVLKATKAVGLFLAVITGMKLVNGLVLFTKNIGMVAGGMLGLTKASKASRLAMLGWKTATLGAFYLLWKIAPDEWKPVVLAIGAITAAIQTMNFMMNRVPLSAGRMAGGLRAAGTAAAVGMGMSGAYGVPGGRIGPAPPPSKPKKGGGIPVLSAAWGGLKKGWNWAGGKMKGLGRGIASLPGISHMLKIPGMKTALRLGGKIGARLIPGLGWALLAMDAYTLGKMGYEQFFNNGGFIKPGRVVKNATLHGGSHGEAVVPLNRPGMALPVEIKKDSTTNNNKPPERFAIELNFDTPLLKDMVVYFKREDDGQIVRDASMGLGPSPVMKPAGAKVP
jgi:hypothetical protein